MNSFEAGSRRLSPRQANRGASPDLVSRAVNADKLPYQLPDVMLPDHPTTQVPTAFLPVFTYLLGISLASGRYMFSSAKGTWIGRQVAVTELISHRNTLYRIYRALHAFAGS